MTALPHDRARATQVVREPQLLALLSSAALSGIGDQVARLAVALLVYQRTGSPLAPAASYACTTLTWLVAGPLLAGLADRLPRRQLMVAADLLRAALVGVLVLPGVPLAAVFGLLVAVSLVSPAYDAARSAVLPEVLDGDRYLVGATLMSNALQGAGVLGLLLGGTLSAAYGPRPALALDALTFLASAALVVRLRVGQQSASESALTLAGSLDGVRLVARSGILRRMLLLGLLGALVVCVPEGLAVPLAAAARGHAAAARAAGVLSAALPAGFVAGSVVLMRLSPPRRVALLPALAVLAGVALLLTPLLSSLPALAALWLLVGACSALVVVANGTYMQAVPPHLRGRAYGVADAALTGGQGLAMLLAGAAATRVAPELVVCVAGAVAAVSGAALLRRGAPVEADAPAGFLPGTSPT